MMDATALALLKAKTLEGLWVAYHHSPGDPEDREMYLEMIHMARTAETFDELLGVWETDCWDVEAAWITLVETFCPSFTGDDYVAIAKGDWST